MKAFTTNRVASALFVLVLIMPALAADVVTARPSLDTGFKLLYSLDFDRAHDFFSAWQREHPEDPMGHVCEAAGVLFSEFNRLGILEGQFYANDKVFETPRSCHPTLRHATASTPPSNGQKKWLAPKLQKTPKIEIHYSR